MKGDRPSLIPTSKAHQLSLLRLWLAFVLEKIKVIRLDYLTGPEKTSREVTADDLITNIEGVQTCQSTFSCWATCIFLELSLNWRGGLFLVVLCVCCDRSDSQADLFLFQKHWKMPRPETGDGRFMPVKTTYSCLSNHLSSYQNPLSLYLYGNQQKLYCSMTLTDLRGASYRLTFVLFCHPNWFIYQTFQWFPGEEELAAAAAAREAAVAAGLLDPSQLGTYLKINSNLLLFFPTWTLIASDYHYLLIFLLPNYRWVWTGSGSKPRIRIILVNSRVSNPYLMFLPEFLSDVLLKNNVI